MVIDPRSPTPAAHSASSVGEEGDAEGGGRVEGRVAGRVDGRVDDRGRSRPSITDTTFLPSRAQYANEVCTIPTVGARVRVT